MSDLDIQVYAHWESMKIPVLMGILTATSVRGKEIFSFSYEREWLKSPYAQIIDPDLDLYHGPQYLRDDKLNFGIFMDSSPDRWGRVLMRRREAAYSRLEERKEQRMFESDYLLGVFDGHRMGGLRFKLDSEGPFLNHDQSFATPPWTSLRELEHASIQLERDDVIDDPDYLKWLRLLITPGSSLGGARPKASVLDENGHLWIAKFPGKNDNQNIAAWEMVAHELAIKAAVTVPEALTQTFTSRHNTFLSKRFDRSHTGERRHFASAMTMLGYMDGSDSQDGVSYLEIVEFLMQYGARTEQDLKELWRRIVFSICISNTDDHLRNHGFLLTPEGWVLSPAYDLNPNPSGMGLSLNISENDNALSVDLALSMAEYFRLTSKQAKEILTTVQTGVSHWQNFAQKYKISRQEQEMMAVAFRY